VGPYILDMALQLENLDPGVIQANLSNI
jgi:hypothetical protein